MSAARLATPDRAPLVLGGTPVRDESDQLLYVDRMCPIVSGIPCGSESNFAATSPKAVIEQAVRRARDRHGWWVVVAWGCVSGRWCSPVGLVRIPDGENQVEFTFFEDGRQDFSVMREHPSEYPDIVARALNQDADLLLGRNLLCFPRGKPGWDGVVDRMVRRIFR